MIIAELEMPKKERKRLNRAAARWAKPFMRELRENKGWSVIVVIVVVVAIDSDSSQSAAKSQASYVWHNKICSLLQSSFSFLDAFSHL